MLEIAQAGQAGKTSLLFDMHRLRKRVFKDRMGWEVSISPDGLEVDQFDRPETVYMLALDDERRVIGNWRLLPATGPTMIHDVWPQFLESIKLPRDPRVWEASRFVVDSLEGDSKKGRAQVSRAIHELTCGLVEISLLCGIREVFTLYDMRIARLFKQRNTYPHRVSARLKIAGNLAEVGAFVMDKAMLLELRAASGIRTPLVKAEMLPPILQDYCRDEQIKADRGEILMSAGRF